MALEDRLGETMARVDAVQRLLAVVTFGALAVIVGALVLGRGRVALWTVVAVCGLLGALQLLLPETLVRASRIGDRAEKSASDPVEPAEQRGKRLGGVLLVLLAAGLVAFRESILGLV